MKGSIDMDKTHCHIELLPRPPESVDTILQVGGGSGSSSEGDEHRVEVTRRTDEFSMVLCFSSATSLSDWMKSVFDVQQRKATFSPLRHGTGGGGGGDGISSGGGESSSDGSDSASDLPGSLPRAPTYINSRGNNSSGIASSGRGREGGGGGGGGGIGSGNRQGRRRGGRRRGRRRGTLASPPPRPPREGGGGGLRGVPSSWADDIDIRAHERGRGRTGETEDAPPLRLRPRHMSTPTSSAVRLGKASERLADLPRGGRAAGNNASSSSSSVSGCSLDEYGAFTTAQASIYEGWTRGLQPHGWGRMVFANGDRVEGWWEHDVLHGSAEYTSRQEGWTYSGGYENGERHGLGRLVFSSAGGGDVWDCEWDRGVVARGSRGTHATADGELYQGGCGPSAADPAMPVRSGQGRLRRRDGGQVDTRFRTGRAVDGAKGVVRFRNGAIFFGELQEARPHG